MTDLKDDSLASALAAAEAWERADVDDADKAELRALVARAGGGTPGAVQAQAELRDRFATRLAFGTAGLRGAMAAGPNRMNRAVVVGAAAGLGPTCAASSATRPRAWWSASTRGTAPRTSRATPPPS
nr:hypothetical protein [Xylanimonas allomyrinae]